MHTREIVLGSQRFLVIDLTEPLTEATEVYPGDPRPQREVVGKIQKNTGFEDYIHRLGDHNFHPHADAPKHANPELQEKGMEVFGFDCCFTSACLIDLSGSSSAKEINGIRFLIEIKKEDLLPFSNILTERTGVLVRTGYDRWVEANKPHQPELLPFFSKAAADFLAGFGNIRVVGTDSITVDKPGERYAHQAFKHKMIVESLTHLHEIPEKARERFDLQTSPVRITGATGGPVVAYAFIAL